MYSLYKITCLKNEKIYIGYTSKTVLDRFKAHCMNARWKKNYALADAIRVYGEQSFLVEFLLKCSSHKEACENEIRLIKELNCTIPNGYNMTYGGDGVPLTPEGISKMSASRKGKITQKLIESWEKRKGRKLSPETKLKLSLIRKGKPKSEEWKRKIGLSNLGKKMSAESRAKISMSKKGKPWSEAARASFILRKQKRISEAL